MKIRCGVFIIHDNCIFMTCAFPMKHQHFQVGDLVFLNKEDVNRRLQDALVYSHYATPRYDNLMLVVDVLKIYDLDTCRYTGKNLVKLLTIDGVITLKEMQLIHFNYETKVCKCQSQTKII